MLHGSRTGLTLAIALVLNATNAFAATYYFSTSGNNTSGQGTQASPFYSLCGPWWGAPCTTGVSKISSNQIRINPGDILLFKRGDVWKGLDAQWSINATGAAGSPITFGAYGDTNLPRPHFNGSKTAFELGLDNWTNVPNTPIWYTTVTWNPRVASQEDTAVDGPHLFGAFSVQGTTNANGWNENQSMVRGTHYYDQATKRLYVWRTDNLKPDHSKGREIYIGMEIWDGTRRLVKVDRGWGGPGGTDYIFDSLHVSRSPEYGFTTSYQNTEYRNCLSELNGMEGFLFDRRRFGTPAPGAKGGILRNSVARRNNMSTGIGIGQGITIEAENVWIYDSESYENAWAGVDFLDYEATTNTSGGGVVGSKIYHNGLSPLADAAFDPNIYIDGGSNITIKNTQVWGAGIDPRGTKTRRRPNPGINIDVESWGYANGKRPNNIKLINVLSYGNMGEAVRIGGINGGQPTGTRAISNVQIIGSTLHRDRPDSDIPDYYNPASIDSGIRVAGLWNVSTGMVFKNNIVIGRNTTRAPLFGDAAWRTGTRTLADFDNNIYFCPNCNYNTNGTGGSGGFFSFNYIENWTIDQWRNAGGTTAQQHDTALSKTIMTSDPLLANMTAGTFDARLQFSSPAFDRAFTGIFPVDLSGTTRADGLPDSPYNDIGYHYALDAAAPAPDTIAPSTPSGVAAAAITARQTRVTWTASTDNIGVSAYRVFRNGTLLATATTVSHTDSTVVPETAYSYTVQAMDAAGNVSGTSASASVTTPAEAVDTTAPSVPVVSVPMVSGGTVTVQWADSTDDVAVTGYRVYRGSTLIGTSIVTTMTDSGVNPGMTYTYTVRAFDAAGNASAPSAAMSVMIPDLPADDAPTSLTATFDGDQVRLNWSAPSAFPTLGYNVFRNGDYQGSVSLLFSWDSGVVPGTTYTYTVCAYSIDGTLSPMSDPFTITIPGSTPDTQAPTVPAGLSGTVSGILNLQASLTWSASSDNVAVTEYRVFLAGAQVATVPSTSYVHTGLLPLTSYLFTVRAVDAAGNISAASAGLSLTTPAAPDTAPPTAPTGLTATPSAGQAALAWEASTDDIGVTGYQVFRGASQIATVTTTSYTMTGLATGTHTFTVKAVDAAGNVSPASAAATATITAVVPGVPTNVSPVLFGTSVQVTWTRPVSGAPIAGYNLYRNNVYVGSFTTTTASDPSVQNGQTYTYTVAAFTASGEVSARSVPASINVVFKPAIVSVTRSTITRTTMVAKWALNVPASGYVLYGRSPDYLTSRSYTVDQAGTQYSAMLSGLIPNRSYYFRVVATNEGGQVISSIRSFETKA